MKHFAIVLGIWLVTCFGICSVSHAEESITSERIQQLFPKATVIGEKQADYPVYPVYTLKPVRLFTSSIRVLASLARQLPGNRMVSNT